MKEPKIKYSVITDYLLRFSVCIMKKPEKDLPENRRL